MPTYFDEKSLTAEQKARWDGAITRYAQVQAENFERQFAAMSRDERKYYEKTYGAKTDAEIRRKMQDFGTLMGNSPGHPKSALFARLLSGKDALPFRPPTSYSYPWYSVIEDAGPHHASLGGAYTAGTLARQADGAKGEFSIGINQCLWAVKGLNAAARTLLGLDMELQSLSREEDPNNGFSSRVYDWTDELLSRVKTAYAQRPEFTIQYGEWPEFRLFVGQIDGHCHRSQKKYAKERLVPGPHHLKRTYSVFDLDSLNINARIGETLSRGKHPQGRLDEALARYEKLAQQAQNAPDTPPFDKAAADKVIANLEAEVQDFESHPDNEDWVEVFLDMWHIEKFEPSNVIERLAA